MSELAAGHLPLQILVQTVSVVILRVAVLAANGIKWRTCQRLSWQQPPDHAPPPSDAQTVSKLVLNLVSALRIIAVADSRKAVWRMAARAAEIATCGKDDPAHAL